ncbi:MAG: hypothetical protein A3E87_03990 [Gammaproteobacteria bacterium RIFCSPHIGHO2_12_FULL_35_23]|nr:MAG: hypothetical protein A3E87_03990 [Gammaproteobacteria bacterium RIFCSPHIGHO2_12_FULL_35_23]
MPALNKFNEFLEEIYKTRVSNLQKIADEYGTDKRLAEVLGISPGRLHSLIRKGDMSFTEKMARAIESRLDKELGSLDKPTESFLTTPVYALDDIKDLKNCSPITYVNHDAKIPGSYFIQVFGKIYEPVICAGSKILINPHNIELKADKIYLFSYIENEQYSRPIIRQYKENTSFMNLVSQEKEIFNQVKVYGSCETVIADIISIVR